MVSCIFNRSEGGARTGYGIPAHDGMGAGGGGKILPPPPSPSLAYWRHRKALLIRVMDLLIRVMDLLIRVMDLLIRVMD